MYSGVKWAATLWVLTQNSHRPIFATTMGVYVPTCLLLIGFK